MKKIVQIGVLLTLLFGMVSFVSPASASAPQNYTVLVGSDDTSKGVSLMSFYPQSVQIHVGDSITWSANSHEIHTVTFLAGEALQPFIIPAPSGMASPLQFNPKAVFPAAPPNGQYDGSTFVNSGILSTDPGFVQTFSLTFTHEGVFEYICYIHGQMMSGTVTVVGSNVSVPSPEEEQAQAQAELKSAWLQVPLVVARAKAQVSPTVINPDGTFTHTITMGYMSGPIMVMGFFPGQVTVRPGDTVVWKMSPMNGEAPHTVTFYNGTPDQPLVVMAQGQNGPVALVNPALLFPSQAVVQGKALNNTDFFNSGIMIPGVQDSFSLKIGNVFGTLHYECALHDTSGMVASLFAAPGSAH